MRVSPTDIVEHVHFVFSVMVTKQSDPVSAFPIPPSFQDLLAFNTFAVARLQPGSAASRISVAQAFQTLGIWNRSASGGRVPAAFNGTAQAQPGAFYTPYTQALPLGAPDFNDDVLLFNTLSEPTRRHVSFSLRPAFSAPLLRSGWQLLMHSPLFQGGNPSRYPRWGARDDGPRAAHQRTQSFVSLVSRGCGGARGGPPGPT